jgi:hypothetical protein
LRTIRRYNRFTEDRIDCHKIHAVQRIPMSLEESGPRA